MQLRMTASMMMQSCMLRCTTVATSWAYRPIASCHVLHVVPSHVSCWGVTVCLHVCAGNACGNGETCTDMVTFGGCGPNSISGCECSPDEIDEGGRCDSYGEPAPFALYTHTSHICFTLRRIDSASNAVLAELTTPSGLQARHE